MIEFFEEYPLLILVVILVVMIAVVYVFFDTKSKIKNEENAAASPSGEQVDVLKKGAKKEAIFKKTSKGKTADGVSQKSQEETTEKKTAGQTVDGETKTEEEQEKPKLVFKKKQTDDSPQKKLRKSKNSKSIEKVYKKVPSKTKEEKSTEMVPSISEEELLEKNVFVKTSKNVYKLVKRDENTELQAFQDELEDALEEYQGGDPEMDSIKSELLKQNHGHFDKSRRLSRCVDENEFDDMFVSHIGDRYLNINTQRHLNIDDAFNERLFRRASQTLSNSNIKIKGNGDINKKVQMSESERDNAQREELARLLLQEDEDSYEENELIGNLDDSDVLTNINAKDLILGQMLMTRKRAKK